MPAYVPRKGDLVTLSFDPQAGHEQRGHRPALVVSNDLFNSNTGLALFCPITNTDRGYPFHVAVPESLLVKGFVMVEQLKSLDYSRRGVRFVEGAPVALVDDVLALIDACIR